MCGLLTVLPLVEALAGLGPPARAGSCFLIVWQILKKKYAGNNYVAKDFALEKFLNLDYHGSITDFIREVCAANQRLVSSKIGLDDQLKNAIILRKLPLDFQSLRTVPSIGCSSNTVAMMLNRLK
ncbi:hypothetical protein PGT21_036827 [Puccinia graminis f. sp. tritici]|uniref:Uncharacterized protein n=1 Tax=Puccinia graminis f. sp. tritici TaxID=56615 RepID=A0A5B0QDB5_PUCGR|nr:hypothetical protein PGT21_036827 [Puccinia graminis f. sp. tritici]